MCRVSFAFEESSLVCSSVRAGSTILTASAHLRVAIVKIKISLQPKSIFYIRFTSVGYQRVGMDYLLDFENYSY